jgi:signal transduction histidine kinase
MGFGLTISKMIVQQLKGTITAQSVVNKGSTFTFEIAAKALKRKQRGNAAVFEDLEELESVPTQEDC